MSFLRHQKVDLIEKKSSITQSSQWGSSRCLGSQPLNTNGFLFPDPHLKQEFSCFKPHLKQEISFKHLKQEISCFKTYLKQEISCFKKK